MSPADCTKQWPTNTKVSLQPGREVSSEPGSSRAQKEQAFPSSASRRSPVGAQSGGGGTEAASSLLGTFHACLHPGTINPLLQDCCTMCRIASPPVACELLQIRDWSH